MLPLVDNRENQCVAYKVSVYTGMRYGAGTWSQVCFTLTGDLGDTGVRVLDDGQGKVSKYYGEHPATNKY